MPQSGQIQHHHLPNKVRTYLNKLLFSSMIGPIIVAPPTVHPSTEHHPHWQRTLNFTELDIELPALVLPPLPRIKAASSSVIFMESTSAHLEMLSPKCVDVFTVQQKLLYKVELSRNTGPKGPGSIIIRSFGFSLRQPEFGHVLVPLRI